MLKVTKALLAGAALWGTVLSPLAWSQNAPQSTEAQTGGLEEVIVTAQKRPENLQLVPVSITALSGTMLDNRNVTTVQGFAEFVPNLTVNPIMGSATAASVYIRGQGYANTEAYVDSPVSTYIDGVLQPRPNVAGLEMVDLQRVEVLRGPQGTLFGRNTTGGALNITTAAPSDEFGFKQSAEYGSDQEFIVKTALDTGLIDGSSFKAKLAYYHHQLEGYVTNISPGATFDAGYRDNDSIWFALDGDLTSRLSMDFRFDYTQLRAVMPASQVIYAAPDYVRYFGNSPNLGGDPFNNSPTRLGYMYLGDSGPEKNTLGGYAMTLNYNVSSATTLKDIVAYRNTTSTSPNSNVTGQGNLQGEVLNPATGVTSVQHVSPFDAAEDINQHQISNELQLLGNLGSFNYVAGFFYFNEKPQENNPLFLTVVEPGGTTGINVNVPRTFSLNTTTKAVYAQGTYTPDVLDHKLQITGGSRYTWDDKSITEPGTFEAKNWSKASWAAALQYNWTPDLMAYFRFASSYKAGGFTPGFAGSYNPENATMYELGLKSDWWDNRLRVNLTAFTTNYKDQQLQETVGGIPLVTNAGRSTFDGGELEITAVPTPRLRVTASWGYINPNYKVYIYSDPVLGNINVADEVHMTYAARNNASIGLVYDVAEGPWGSLNTSVDFHYESRRWFFPLDRQLPYNELISGPPIYDLRARITWANFITTKGGATFSGYIWGANLLNKIQITTGTDWTPMPFATAVFSRPRSEGIGIDMKF